MISKHETCNASLPTKKEKENGGNVKYEFLEKMFITGLLDDSEGIAANIHLTSSGGDMKIWDMPELAMARTFSSHSQPVGSLCWSPNSMLLSFCKSQPL